MSLAPWLLLVLQHLPLPVEAALAAEDYGAAREAALAVEPGVARQRALSELLYRARDPAGALAAAESGLAGGEDLFLLHRATSAALWLEDGAEARRYNRRLAAAVAGAELTAAERAGWDDAVQGFALEIEDRLARDARHRAAVQRARLVATALLALPLVGMLVLLARGTRAAPASG